jgi:4,5-DOPA dioxygenase extradiol
MWLLSHYNSKRAQGNKYKKQMSYLSRKGLSLLSQTEFNVATPMKSREDIQPSKRMPVLFLGHGNPMNGIEENEFVEGFREIARKIPKPKTVLCVSAHWETKGTFVTAMDKPKTIHDFFGFPEELYEVQYPAPGNPALAEEIVGFITKTKVDLDYGWGLDHGCWVVLKRMFPDADVPVVQISLDYSKPAQFHYDLAKELSKLREKGVLIIGSGNMVHNLGLLAWDNLTSGFGYDWAIEANDRMKKFIVNNDHQQLIDYRSQGRAFDLAIPTPEHYLPLLYVLAMKRENEDISFFNDKPVAGSLTMTSIKINEKKPV